MSEWIKNVTREVTIFPAVGVTRSMGQTSKTFDIPFDYEHILFVDNTWYYQRAEFDTIKKIFRERIDQDPGYVLEIVNKQQRVGEGLKSYVKELINQKFSQSELAATLLEYDQRMVDFYNFWWIAIPGGEVLEEKVRALLSSKHYPVVFEDWLFVRPELELIREKRLRLEIGLRCAEVASYDQLPRELQQELEAHAKTFGWTNTSYHIGTPLTARDFFERIQSEDLKVEQQQIQAERARQEALLQKLAIDFSLAEQKLIEAMQAVIYLRNYQKETVNECQHRSEPFLHQVADYLGVSLAVVLTFSAQELRAYLLADSSKPADLIKIAAERSQGFVVEYRDKKIAIHTTVGPYQALVKGEHRDESITEIKGSPACRGVVQGQVRVINKKEEIANFVDGEILVTVMTSIDYVQVMKRASAIVTDEGGITCHAAIFSREFGIPCIIGTHNATKVFKTGDLVEVDAERGLVRKI